MKEREKKMLKIEKGSSHYKWMTRPSPFRRRKIGLQGLANDFVCVPKKIPPSSVICSIKDHTKPYKGNPEWDETLRAIHSCTVHIAWDA